MSDPAVRAPVHPPWLVPVLHILFASAIYFCNRVLILAFLAFELYWLVLARIPSRYSCGPKSNWSDAYSYGGNVSAVVGRSVSFLLFMKPEKDFVPVQRSESERQTVADAKKSTDTELPLWKRWFRCLDLVIASRGVGRGIPSREHPAR